MGYFFFVCRKPEPDQLFKMQSLIIVLLSAFCLTGSLEKGQCFSLLASLPENTLKAWDLFAFPLSHPHIIWQFSSSVSSTGSLLSFVPVDHSCTIADTVACCITCSQGSFREGGDAVPPQWLTASMGNLFLETPWPEADFFQHWLRCCPFSIFKLIISKENRSLWLD